MKNPLVSVILATHNRERYIKRAIDSVLNQTLKDFELIVVNDYSIDDTYKVVSEYVEKDNRIVILNNEKNFGQIKSSKRGIAIARGKYIARIDDDDVWRDSKKLEKQVGFMESHLDYVLAGGGVVVVDSQRKELVRFLHPEKDKEIRKRMLFCTQFVHSSVVFRRDAYNLVGGYDENLDCGEDWDLCLKLGQIGKLYNFQEYFLTYLRHSRRKTAKWRNEIKYDSDLRKKYKDFYPNYRRAVFFGFISYIYYRLPFVREIFYPLSAIFRKISFNLLTLSLNKKK